MKAWVDCVAGLKAWFGWPLAVLSGLIGREVLKSFAVCQQICDARHMNAKVDRYWLTSGVFAIHVVMHVISRQGGYGW